MKGSLNGNASSASKPKTPRTLSLTGAVAGSGVFDGSGDLSIVGIAEVFFNGETRPIAAKAGITVNTYAGHLTLTAAKQPAGTPVIETITLIEKT